MMLYLVGDDESAKNNSWWAMTNSQEKAADLLVELPGATQIKAFVPKEAKKNGSNNG